jgi:hypothetical protein
VGDSHTVTCDLEKSGQSISIEQRIDDYAFKPQRTRGPSKTYKDWKEKLLSRVSGAMSKAEAQECAKEDIKIGTTLLKILFPDQQSRGALKSWLHRPGVLNIDIKTSDTTLSSIPWEVCAKANWKEIADIEKPDCEVVIIRSPAPFSTSWKISDAVVRVFVAGSNPIGRPVPNFSKELDAINNALVRGLGTNSGKHKVYSKDGITLPEIKNLINSNLSPNIFHLVSHGGSSYVEMEKADGHSTHVYAQELANALQNNHKKLYLFVTTACLAMQDDPEQGQVGIGNLLVRNIPFTIGMQLAVREDVVMEFNKELYYSLAKSQNIVDAYIGARNAVYKFNPESPAWIAPVIYQGVSQPERIFEPFSVVDYLAAVINQIRELILVLNNDLRSLDSWNRVLPIINQITTEVVYPSQDEGSGMTVAQRDLISGKIKPAISSIRGELAEVCELFEQADVRIKMKYGFGNKAQALVDKIEKLNSLLKELRSTF